VLPFLQLGTKQFLAADFSPPAPPAAAASPSAAAPGPGPARRLWARFEALDRRLWSGGDTAQPRHVRSFLGPPSVYEYERLQSPPFDLESVVAQWGSQGRL
jgi:hypothetical protein